MVCSSLQIKAFVVFLILSFMVFDCSSIPIHTNSTNSKPTQENSTISVDYLQSVSYDINDHISAMKTSHGAETKPNSHVNKSQSDVTWSKSQETSVMNNINNILAADSSHSSRSVRRLERSTQGSTSETGRNISSESRKWVSYLAHCIGASSDQHHHDCSVNISKLNMNLKIGNRRWDHWYVEEACQTIVCTNEYSVTAVCQNANNRHQDEQGYACRQVYLSKWLDHPVGCVKASRKSVLAKESAAPRLNV